MNDKNTCDHDFQPVYGLGVNPLGYDCYKCGITKEEYEEQKKLKNKDSEIDWMTIDNYYTACCRIDFCDDADYYHFYAHTADQVIGDTIEENLNWIAAQLVAKYNITRLKAIRYVNGLDFMILVMPENINYDKYIFCAGIYEDDTF
jgi:hypothetical protein